MPPKKAVPAPIDRPLSKAYLREFTGWSTAYPPGLSDPTSLRIMENAQINRDGSLKIRPGLRYLSYSVAPSPEDSELGVGYDKQFVGTHEAFYLNDGTKAYLFAVREDDDTVGFRVLSFAGGDTIVYGLTDPGIDFDIPQGEASINFSAETTYVKYLQVDNKIFALSDAGETMRLFYVGATKQVRKLLSIERPNYDVADKLTVVHPDALWITGASPTALRTNLAINPTMVGIGGWTPDSISDREQTTVQAKSGDTSMLVKSLPTRRNLMDQPLHNLAVTGTGQWDGGDIGTLSVVSGWLRLSAPADTYQPRTRYAHWAGGLLGPITPGQKYRVSCDVQNVPSSTDLEIDVRFYTSGGTQVGVSYVQSTTQSSGRFVSNAITAPTGGVKMRVRIGYRTTSLSAKSIDFRNVLVCLDGEPTTFFSGDSGANFFWLGTANASDSVFHAPAQATIRSNLTPIDALASVVAAAELRAETAGDGQVGIEWFNSLGVSLGTDFSSLSAVSTSGWTQKSIIASAPATATHAAAVVRFSSVPRDDDRYVDEVMLEIGSSLNTYFDGDTDSTLTLAYGWDGVPNESTSSVREYGAINSIPPAETPTDNTLIVEGTVTDDEFDLGIFYNFAFFYTFSNEIGESAASQVTTVKTQRGWSAWRWETANSLGEPSGNPVADPTRAADQLVAYMPEEVFDAAVAVGAKQWNLYMLTWSNQTVVPVVGVKVAVVDLTNNPTYDSLGWAQVTPQSQNINEESPVPHITNLRNYSAPSRGGQGLIAADRMVVVHDPTDQAVIRWTGNEQGDYINFTASRGGGYKTLTSGNLFIPAAVKLWQNPQSTDTITILCRGTDGHSTSYYMAPASVTSQSDTTQVMGFEETTATAGTTSPYGCEVLNNSLYHPVDEQLTKSTASNYNINHKSMTDMIEDRWSALQRKDRIISSQLDNRIYYIVNNPEGLPLEDGMNGNEIWVLDGAAETPTWSRWLIQAHALRKIEQGGRVYMSVVRPDGIYYFDPLYNMDDYLDEDNTVLSRFIPWRIETNTQGANRAHDAWCWLQQLQLSLGNFVGTMEWGLRSWDVNGKPVDKSKQITKTYAVGDNIEEEALALPFDLDDHLQIRKNVMQWYFYAGSVLDEDGETVLESFGQINNVQYRYAPVSVNVGYEYGSVETFEYGRDLALADSNTNAGVPKPYNDQRRP